MSESLVNICIIDILQLQDNPFGKRSRTEERSPMTARMYPRADTPDQIGVLAKPVQPKANYLATPDTSNILELQQDFPEAQEEIKELKAIIAKLHPMRTRYIPANSKEKEELVNRKTAWILRGDTNSFHKIEF
jgi:hypothetical protein